MPWEAAKVRPQSLVERKETRKRTGKLLIMRREIQPPGIARVVVESMEVVPVVSVIAIHGDVWIHTLIHRRSPRNPSTSTTVARPI